MSNYIAELFDNGKLNFNLSGDGEEWTFTAIGDDGILPGVAENVARNGIEPLAVRIKELTKADSSITNLEIGL